MVLLRGRKARLIEEGDVKINFDGTDDDLSKGGSAPPGTYLCEVTGAKESATSAGDERMSFSLKIIDGEHAGKSAGFDSIIPMHANERARKRAKFVLRRLGFDVDRPEFFLDAEEMNGRRAMVTTELDPKCPACKWGVVPKGKDKVTGEAIWGCTKQDCGAMMAEEKTVKFTKPTFDGYEKVDGEGERGASGEEFDINSVPF
jgi:hypothetical protein